MTPLVWRSSSVLLIVAVVLALVAPVVHPVAAAQPAAQPIAAPAAQFTDTYPFYDDDAIAAAVAYLQTQQEDSGGINGFGSGADAGSTSRTILVLNALGYPTDALQSGSGNTMRDYLAAEVVGYIYANDTPATANLFPGRAGLVLAAVAAAGGDPRSFGGVDLIGELEAAYAAAGDNTYSTAASEGFSSGAASASNQAFAILGLVAAAQPVPPAATDWLLGEQGDNGIWGGSIDLTGTVLIALIGSGNVAPTDSRIQAAITALRDFQSGSSALWGDGGSSEPANSTGWAATALTTLGFTPLTASFAAGGTNPRAAIVALQDAEGAIGKNFINAYSTFEGLYALSDQPLFFAQPLRTQRALTWLATQQAPAGGWGFSQASPDAGTTIDAILAYVAGGVDPATVQTNGNSPLDYLATQAASYTRDDSDVVFPAQTGKLINGLLATGEDPTSFASLNLVTDLQNTLQPTGAYSSTAARGFSTGAAGVTTQSFAMLGLAAAGEPVPQSAIDFLKSLQAADDSFGSPDTTGLALQALLAAGVPNNDPVVVATLTHLRDTQDAGGGWASFGNVNSNSTAYATQGLLAAGVDLGSDTWLKNGRTPQTTLHAYQKPDGPFVNYWGSNEFFNPQADNISSTAQAVPAMRGAFYPYRAPATPLAAFTPVATGPDPDRLVVGPLTARSSNGTFAVAATYGSDLDGDGTATLAYDVQAVTLQAFTELSADDVTRTAGAFTATLDAAAIGFEPGNTLTLQAAFGDPAQVQNGGTLGTNVGVTATPVQPERIFLPFVVSNN